MFCFSSLFLFYQNHRLEMFLCPTEIPSRCSLAQCSSAYNYTVHREIMSASACTKIKLHRFGECSVIVRHWSYIALEHCKLSSISKKFWDCSMMVAESSAWRCLCLLGMGVLERKSMDDNIAELKEKFLPTYIVSGGDIPVSKCSFKRSICIGSSTGAHSTIICAALAKTDL